MKSVFVFLLLVTSLRGMAAPGGGVQFCPGKRKPEAYDVFEGRKKFQMNFDTNQNNEVEIIENAIRKIKLKNFALGTRVESEVSFLHKAENFVLDPRLNILTPVSKDEFLSEKGCFYKQVTTWDKVSNRVYVDATSFNKLSAFHKAALRLHEAIHLLAMKSSMNIGVAESRKFVGEILSLDKEIDLVDIFRLRTDPTISTSVRPSLSFKGNRLEVELGKFNPDVDEAVLTARATMLARLVWKRKELLSELSGNSFFKRGKLRNELNHLDGLFDELPIFNNGRTTRSDIGHWDKLNPTVVSIITDFNPVSNKEVVSLRADLDVFAFYETLNLENSYEDDVNLDIELIINGTIVSRMSLSGTDLISMELIRPRIPTEVIDLYRSHTSQYADYRILKFYTSFSFNPVLE